MLDTNNINQMSLTPHFGLNEFECPCCKQVRLHPRLLTAAEDFRVDLGYPFTPNAAFRCTRHNQDVGGKHGSYHLFGMAIDYSQSRFTDTRIFRSARKAGFKGIILNRERGYWHFDVRPGRPYYDVPGVDTSH